MKDQALEKKEEQRAVTTANHCTYTPKVDIWETEDGYTLQVEMPGVDQKGVDVKLEDNVLRIIGRTQAESFDGYKKIWSEYEFGNYERQFQITEKIDEAKIQASFKDGSLSLLLPKREAAKPKRIEVKVA